MEFDLDGIDPTKVTRATLVLTIRKNFNNWGSGRPIVANPLRVPFAEGNGKDLDLPARFRTRGTGAGVTWECASDANVANLRTDCPASWGGGDFVPTDAMAMIHNQQMGEVNLDVTKDVQAGAHSWPGTQTQPVSSSRNQRP